VPPIRSFTIDTAVMTVVRNDRTKPNVPATMKRRPVEPRVEHRPRRHLDAVRAGAGARPPLRDERGAGRGEDAPHERLGVPGERGLAAVVDHLPPRAAGPPRRAASSRRSKSGGDDERGARAAADERAPRSRRASGSGGRRRSPSTSSRRRAAGSPPNCSRRGRRASGPAPPSRGRSRRGGAR